MKKVRISRRPVVDIQYPGCKAINHLPVLRKPCAIQSQPPRSAITPSRPLTEQKWDTHRRRPSDGSSPR